MGRQILSLLRHPAEGNTAKQGIQGKIEKVATSAAAAETKAAEGKKMSDKIPETLEETKKCFEDHGYKTIGIVFGEKHEKKPDPRFTHAKLEAGDYSYDTKSFEAIAMVHGPVSGTYAIDIDFKKKSHNVEEAIKVLFNDVQKTCDKTLVIKTPKQGVHFIFTSPDGAYPEQKKYYSKKYPGVEIDIRSTHGYTLIPPSLHPEKQYGNYSFISSTLIPAKMKWDDAKMVLAERGFFTKDQGDGDGDGSSTTQNDYDTSKLLMGKFPRGKRRVSQNSLYIKLRIRGSSVQEAGETVRTVNRKCDEPLDDKEIAYNIKYAEAYYRNAINITWKIGDGSGDGGGGDGNGSDITPSKKKPEGISAYDGADRLMDEYDFITHISGEIYYYASGIYRKHGELLIKKKARQYWEILGIDTGAIAEIINIIKDRTTILSENDDFLDIFDTEYKKVILKNGMYDFENLEFGDYDKNVLATVKHPIYYDDAKTCPNFDAFLDTCFDNDEVKKMQVLEMMSLCLIKKYIIQKGYVNYGIGSNGKTTYMGTLRNMLGIQNTTSIPMQEFQKSQFVGYEVRGKCANVSGDGGTEPITKTGFIKSVLGGDAIRCEQKFRDPFDFIPFITLIFTFNELPVVNDSSDGFARKIQPIHWSKKFYLNNRNPEVDKIPHDSDERSGIFNRLIPIIKRLIDERRLKYENTPEETKAVWLSRSDSFFRYKSECIVLGNDHDIGVKRNYDTYKYFCEENGMTAVSERELYTKISEMLGGVKSKRKHVEGVDFKFWRGFTTLQEIQEEKMQTAIDKV